MLSLVIILHLYTTPNANTHNWGNYRFTVYCCVLLKPHNQVSLQIQLCMYTYSYFMYKDFLPSKSCYNVCQRWMTCIFQYVVTIVICIYVTVFVKTDPNCTKSEIRFIAEYQTFTLALPRIPNTWLQMAKSAFTDGLLLSLSEHEGALQGLQGQ